MLVSHARSRRQVKPARGPWAWPGGPDRALADNAVAFVPEPVDSLRIMQLERRPLRPDPRRFEEVAPRRRAGRRRLQRVDEVPRIVHLDWFAVPVALEDVVDERQHRAAAVDEVATNTSPQPHRHGDSAGSDRVEHFRGPPLGRTATHPHHRRVLTTGERPRGGPARCPTGKQLRIHTTVQHAVRLA